MRLIRIWRAAHFSNKVHLKLPQVSINNLYGQINSSITWPSESRGSDQFIEYSRFFKLQQRIRDFLKPQLVYFRLCFARNFFGIDYFGRNAVIFILSGIEKNAQTLALRQCYLGFLFQHIWNRFKDVLELVYITFLCQNSKES